MQAQGPFDRALNGLLRLLPKWHRPLEAQTGQLTAVLLITILAGSAIGLAPLWLPGSTSAQDAAAALDRSRPYAPLELAGFVVYVQEGCHTCHSQQIRDKPRTVARYGPPSQAFESRYDHPMQWGSKRLGPDLARIGGRHADAWLRRHLTTPQAVTPGSVMPPYGFLAERPVDVEAVRQRMQTLRRVGVPYTDAMLDQAATDLRAQGRAGGDTAGLLTRYPGARVNASGGSAQLTEMDALIAYLQVLGTFIAPDAAGADVRS